MIPRPRLSYPDRNVASFLDDAVNMCPERSALVCGDVNLSYRELDALSNSVAQMFRDAGAGPDRRVAINVGNRTEWILSFFGALRAGASVVAPNPRWKPAELAHALTLTEPRVVIMEQGGLHKISGDVVQFALGDASPGEADFWQAVRAYDGSPIRQVPNLSVSQSEALVLFSSGTTGVPKAVRHSHRSLQAAMINWKSAIRLEREDRQQMVLPLFTVLGASTVLGSAAAGASLFLRRKFDLNEMLQEIETARITMSSVVAPIAVQIASHPNLESIDLSSLRFLVWAATAANPEIAQEVSRRTGIRWLLAYGLTELPGLHCNPAEYPERCRLDTPGLPRSDAEVRIVDPVTLDDVPAGESGEIIARSPALMMGYIPASADQDVFLPDGWFRTGDIGRVEPDGWLHIEGRIKELIKVSGLQVAPAEVEAVLLSSPDVADCAVFGVPDSAKEEVPVAAIVWDEASRRDEAALLAWLGQRLSRYKVPRAVLAVGSIPRTASGKTIRHQLRASFGHITVES